MFSPQKREKITTITIILKGELVQCIARAFNSHHGGNEFKSRSLHLKPDQTHVRKGAFLVVKSDRAVGLKPVGHETCINNKKIEVY